MRRLAVASAILATFLALPLGMAAATPQPSVPVTDAERATAALEYLLAAQRPDGSIDGSLGETADLVIGAAATGYDPATLRGCSGGTGALAFLATASDAASTDAAATGKAILAVLAAGDDPASFSGRDLVARLAGLYDSATGAYGDGSTFSQSFAILAVKASGGTVPAAALTTLAALQNATDGSWSYGSAPVPAGQGDSNSTAIALMALDAAGDTSADSAGLAYLKTQQVADGGFVYSTAWGSTSDPDSDSIVLQALIEAGQGPTSTAWSEGSNDVLTDLRSSQGADGGFIYPGSGESAFTTSQVPAALMEVPYAGTYHPTAGQSVPTILCSAATPSPSPTVTPTPVPTATPSPTPTASPTSTPTNRPTPAPTARPTPAPTARPTPVPTPGPALNTPASTPAPTPLLTAGPADLAQAVVPASPTPGLGHATTGSGVPGSGAQVRGATSGPGNSSSGGADPAPPPALLYGAAALIGLVLVFGGGWVFFMRPGRR
jgi:hypothetical protein